MENNNTYLVLAPTADILAANNNKADLAVGQLGAFEFGEDTSLNSSTIQGISQIELATRIQNGSDTIIVRNQTPLYRQAGRTFTFDQYRAYTPKRLRITPQFGLSSFINDKDITEYSVNLNLKSDSFGWGGGEKDVQLIVKVERIMGNNPIYPMMDANLFILELANTIRDNEFITDNFTVGYRNHANAVIQTYQALVTYVNDTTRRTNNIAETLTDNQTRQFASITLQANKPNRISRGYDSISHYHNDFLDFEIYPGDNLKANDNDGITITQEQSLRFERYTGHQVARDYLYNIQANGKGNRELRTIFGTLNDNIPYNVVGLTNNYDLLNIENPIKVNGQPDRTNYLRILSVHGAAGSGGSGGTQINQIQTLLNAWGT